MPTAALATAAALLLAALDEQEVRDLMFSVGNGIAVFAFFAGLAFFVWAFNRPTRK